MLKEPIIFFCLLLLIGMMMCQTTQPEKRVLVTAHRGASGLAPENTLASIVKAMELGADYSELDVQETTDGIVVLLHDDTVDRTTDRTGNIWELSFDDLQGIDAGSWFSPEYQGEPIPTLETIIDTVYGKMKLNIELKMSGHQKALTEKVVELIENKNFISQCIVTSFDREAVRQVKTANPKIRTGYIFDTLPAEDIYHAEFDLISVNRKLVNQEMVKKAQANNKEVHVWTVNEPDEMRKLIELGVDSIITNYPNILIEILKEK